MPQSLFLAGRLLLRERKALIRLHPVMVALGSRAGSSRYRTATLQASKIVSLSQLVTAPELRAVAFGLRRQQVMDVVRGATFIGALLLAWISLRPFVDLGDQQLKDTSYRQRRR